MIKDIFVKYTCMIKNIYTCKMYLYDKEYICKIYLYDTEVSITSNKASAMIYRRYINWHRYLSNCLRRIDVSESVQQFSSNNISVSPWTILFIDVHHCSLANLEDFARGQREIVIGGPGENMLYYISIHIWERYNISLTDTSNVLVI